MTKLGSTVMLSVASAVCKTVTQFCDRVCSHFPVTHLMSMYQTVFAMNFLVKFVSLVEMWD